MATKGLWRLELKAMIYRFVPLFLLLLLNAALTVFGYDYLIKNMPELFTTITSLGGDYQAYIWSQWFAKNLFQIITLAAVIFGATMIAGEKSRNTLQFVVSKPLRRSEYLLVKYISVYSALALAVVLSTLSLYVLILADGSAISAWWLLENTVLLLLGMALLLTVAGYFSIVMETSLKAMGFAWLAVFLISIPGFFDAARYFSLFYYMKGTSLMETGSFPLLAALIMLLGTTGLYYLGRKEFVKQDL